MPARLLLIRHGETIWNKERRSQGFSDVPLSETGRAQAEALAGALANAPLAAVYCSDLSRALHTAEQIAAPHRVLVKIDVRLRELNQGELEGTRLEGLLNNHPELLKKWMSEPAEVVMPGGESLRSLQARAWKAITEIADRHPDDLAAVVAHNLCLISAICRAINLDLNHFRRLRLQNASISELEFASHGPILTRLNDLHHLSPSSTVEKIKFFYFNAL